MARPGWTWRLLFAAALFGIATSAFAGAGVLTSVVTDTNEKATFFSADGASCVTTNAALTAIECTIGQLKAGESFPTFFVFFKAPAKDKITPLPDGDVDHCAS